MAVNNLNHGLRVSTCWTDTEYNIIGIAKTMNFGIPYFKCLGHPNWGVRAKSSLSLSLCRRIGIATQPTNFYPFRHLWALPRPWISGYPTSSVWDTPTGVCARKALCLCHYAEESWSKHIDLTTTLVNLTISWTWSWCWSSSNAWFVCTDENIAHL